MHMVMPLYKFVWIDSYLKNSTVCDHIILFINSCEILSHFVNSLFDSFNTNVSSDIAKCIKLELEV